MKQKSKLSQHEQHLAAHTQQHQQAGQEFAGPEELLRFDAAQTPVPPQIAERLKQSVPPAAPRSWWRNLFGA